MPFEIEDLSLPGLKLVKPKVFGDNRGYFLETYKKSDFLNAGISCEFVQSNQSFSTQGVLRGLHYQLKYPQAKLVRATQGTILDVAVDMRLGSPTFGQHYAVMLDDQAHHMLFIPEGFAHGFSIQSEQATLQYQCSELYHPEDEVGIIWNDPDINVDWQLTDEPTLSDKDKLLEPLKNMPESLLPRFTD